jgi:hypothetical protein
MGTGGTGGAPAPLCTTSTVAVGDVGLIDDFDDGDASILPNDGRAGGSWWFSTSATAMTTPAGNAAIVPVEIGGSDGGAKQDGGRRDAGRQDAGRRDAAVDGGAEDAGAADGGPLAPAPRALHVSGTDMVAGNGWGGSVDAVYASSGTCYDATKYKGISLSLRGKVGSQVFVQVHQAAQWPSHPNDPPAIAGPYRKVVTLTADWQKVMINFSDLQPGWGTMIPFEVAKTYGVGVSTVPPSDADGGATWSFDFWVDDIAFF